MLEVRSPAVRALQRNPEQAVLLPPADASLANAMLSSGQPAAAPARSLGLIVERLYERFNRCDAEGTAACFTEDVVYEDLLLGNSTLVESREDFFELIQGHPVFLVRQLCTRLSISGPHFAICIDGISEDLLQHTVGVEWHVEVDGEPLSLGRGLSFMRICPRTGLVKRAVDIAEAPWRVVGLLIAPFARGLRGLLRIANSLVVAPVIVSGSASLAVGLLAFVFLDRQSMRNLRSSIDLLDDYRGNLQGISVGDVFPPMEELSQAIDWSISSDFLL